MKAGTMAAGKSKFGEIPRRLKKFITEDVRKNRILGLYLVIGVMVVGYAIYFAVVMYKDFTSGGDKQVASKPRVVRAKKAPPPKKQLPAKKKASVAAPPKQTSKQAGSGQAGSSTEKIAAKVKTAAAKKLDTRGWQSFEFPDGSSISFPADWKQSAVPAEKSILHGVHLQAPGTRASLKCYSRSRRFGDNYAESLKETMKRAGYTKIKEETKKVNQRDVDQLSGMLADKHMVVTIFDDQPDRYFIVRLIVSKQEVAKLRPYYTAVVDSYADAGTSSTSTVSIEKIEQQLEKSIEKDKDYLVGSTIYIKLKSGARHRGVVIAEDDTSITLESFRFGGKYSFTVKKKDITELVR